jgi:mRNA interferase HigB
MRIITYRRLMEAVAKYPVIRPKIEFWYAIAKAAKWTNFAQTRMTLRHADQVTAKSGRVVTVFNLGDAFRLITAIHYDRERIFILRVLTHADYDKDNWKEAL